MSSTSPQPEVKPRDEVKPRLCVVLACHHVVCALPIDNIDRLVLPEAVEALPSSRQVASAERDDQAVVPEVVRVGERFFAAWDLGVLFGLGPVAGAWVLLSLMHEGEEVWLALRTGPCFAVQSLRNLMKLPSEVFQSRRGALTDGFATSVVKRQIEAKVGVLVDPRGLWSRQELQMSAAVLAAVEGRGRGQR